MAAKASKPHSLQELLRDETTKAMELSFLKHVTNNFSEEHEIGRGGYGVVYKGTLLDGFVAVKKFKLSSVLEDKSFRREVTTLMMIKHTNIVRILGYCGDTQTKVAKEGGEIKYAKVPEQLLCLEYLSNGSLGKYLAEQPCGLEWDVCYQIIKGICLGLDYLHAKRIIHRDLKPGNILLDDEMVPKIADFGLSRVLGEEKSRTFSETKCGTRRYMAPEYWREGKITFKSDIYSLGVIIRDIVAGRNSRSTTDNGFLDEVTTDDVLESWRRRSKLDESQRQEILYQQVKACIEISVRCMDTEPENRPVTRDIILMLDKTGSAAASGIKYTPPLGGVYTIIRQILRYPILLLSGREVSVEPSPPILKNLGSERTTSAKCHMLQSGELQIEHAANYWKKISLPNSRFDECAELLHVYFLAISGEISPRELSADTNYAVYLVYQLAGSTSGLKGAVQTSSMRLYGERIVATSKVSLDPSAHGGADVTYPVARGDGWWELKLAEFANDDETLKEQAVIVDLREENVSTKKSGLIVEGMEFRAYN